jgi:hypothetical protein
VQAGRRRTIDRNKRSGSCQIVEEIISIDIDFLCKVWYDNKVETVLFVPNPKDRGDFS